MFVELHEYYGGVPIIINLNKAETIRDGHITFQNYAVNVKETYEELKAMLNNMGNNYE